MRRLCFLAIFMLILPVSFGLNAAAPCQRYSCFDTSSPSFECPDGLIPVRGWCSGTNNIQMCGLPGTPDGPYLKTQQGIETKEKILKGESVYCGPDVANEDVTKMDDFTVRIDGRTDCGYWVENNGIKTREVTPIECGSDAMITVGSSGDCRESGECIVWSDGGLFGMSHRAGTFEISATQCRSKEQFTCMAASVCKSRDGKPQAGLCPGPVDYQCCIIGDDVELEDFSKHLYDNAGILTRDSQIERTLAGVYKSKNVKVIVETINSIGQDPAGMLRARFAQYKLNEEGKPGLNLLIVYGRRENKFLIGHSKECSFTEQELNVLVSAEEISSFMQRSDYNTAFLFITDSVKRLIDASDGAPECELGEARDCSRCGQGFLNILSGCTANACEKLGCSFNQKYRICSDIEIRETRTTIEQRLISVRNGFKGFILKDPLCLGSNCAGYVTRAHEYIFGIGKRFITGVGGNAWDIPRYVENNYGDAEWFDWRDGETFTDYDRLLSGDMIGFYYSQSDYLPEKKGDELGNTPDIDFTHVALYLGKKGDEHIITHLYHPPGSSEDPVRIESIENFLRRFGSFFKVRVLVRPNQEALYRTIPDGYNPRFEIAEIKSGSLREIVRSATGRWEPDYAWITADINSLVENVNLAKYEGNTIRIPTSLPKEYSYEYLSAPSLNDADNILTMQLESAIKAKYPNNAEAKEWATAIVKNAKYKKPEYVSLIASFAGQESSFNANPDNLKERISKLDFFVRDFFGTNPQGPTLGCMQIRLCKAYGIAAANGINRDVVYDSINTMNGCLLYGNKYVEEIAGIYAPNGVFTDAALMYISGDYAAGAYSSRNAAVQEQLNDMMGTNLALDGDMLSYQDTCPPNPASTPSNTEIVARDFMKARSAAVTDRQVREMLMQEKAKSFENTQFYRELKKVWKEKFGREPEYAIVPDAKKRSEGSSITYAKATKNSYNFYCTSIGCSNPSQILVDVDLLHAGLA